MLVEEIQHGLVTSLILLDNLGVFQVRTSGHPAMNLCRERLDMVGDGEISLEGTDIIGWLVLGGQTRERHVDGFGVVGVDHGRVSLGGGLEDLVVSTRGESGDLSTPAETQNRPGLECTAWGRLVGLLHDLRDL